MHKQKTVTELYKDYCNILQKAADFNNAAAVLSWDQEVYMPEGGSEVRARQQATLVEAAHELLTSEKLGSILEELSGKGGLAEIEAANVFWSYSDYKKNTKLPATFIAQLSFQASNAFNAWVDSRKHNDFKQFEPHLASMVALKQQQAQLMGFETHPYNALLDEYDAGSNVTILDTLFEQVRLRLHPILHKIKQSEQVSDGCFFNQFPKEQQWDFSISVLQKMGYDFKRGRQDYAPHPFSIAFAPDDVRITTRVKEDDFGYMLWSSIHEGGHALYEQGLSNLQYGLPCGSAASLSIHESQSRLWENCVGRGVAFWKYFYPQLQSLFPTQLGNVDEQVFYKAMNRVAPSLIRTEADEITYHFHVMIRYELEKKILDGSVKVSELPSLWNEMYTTYLGITPQNDSEGILQDVHWSHGSFGYFPTYSTGSFYAAQFFAQAQKEISGLSQSITDGNLLPLLEWLRSNIHQHGRRYTSQQLCETVTGEGLNLDYFLDYINEKYTTVYQ